MGRDNLRRTIGGKPQPRPMAMLPLLKTGLPVGITVETPRCLGQLIPYLGAGRPIHCG